MGIARERWQIKDPAAMHMCVRCGRDKPRRELAKLTVRAGGGLACSPKYREEYEKCAEIARKLTPSDH